MSKTDLTTINEFYQKHLIDELQDIVCNHPFHAFVIMGATIEIFGRLINPERSLSDHDKTHDDFDYAIKEIKAFEDYKATSLDIYSSLRCSLVHQMLPGGTICLTKNVDNPSKGQFGAEQMYDRIKNAWIEIAPKVDAHQKMNKKGAMVTPTTTAATPSHFSKQACKLKE